MGNRLIVQPNGKYAVFSTIVDRVALSNFTREELIEQFATDAADRARKETADWIDTERPGRRHWSVEEIVAEVRSLKGDEAAEEDLRYLTGEGE